MFLVRSTPLSWHHLSRRLLSKIISVTSFWGFLLKNISWQMISLHHIQVRRFLLSNFAYGEQETLNRKQILFILSVYFDCMESLLERQLPLLGCTTRDIRFPWVWSLLSSNLSLTSTQTSIAHIALFYMTCPHFNLLGVVKLRDITSNTPYHWIGYTIKDKVENNAYINWNTWHCHKNITDKY